MARYAGIFHEGAVLAEGGSAAGELAEPMLAAAAGMPEAASCVSLGCGRLFALFRRDRGSRATVHCVCASRLLRTDEARSLLAIMEMLLASWQAQAEGGSTLAHLAADPTLLGSLQAALRDTLLPFTRRGNALGEPPVYPRVHFQRPRAQQVDEVAPPPGTGARVGAGWGGGAGGGWREGAEEDAAEEAWEVEEKRRRRERNLAIQSMRSKSGIPAVHLLPGDASLNFDAPASAAAARALGMSLPFSRMPLMGSNLGAAGGAMMDPGQRVAARREAPQEDASHSGTVHHPLSSSALRGEGVSPASGSGTPKEATLLQEGGSERSRRGGGSSRVLRTSFSEGPQRQRSGTGSGGATRGAASPDEGRPSLPGDAGTGVLRLPRRSRTYHLSPASWQGQPSPTARAPDPEAAGGSGSGRLTPRERLLLEIAEMQREVKWRGSPSASHSTSTASSLASPAAHLGPISGSAPILTPSSSSRAPSDRGSPGAGFGGGGAPRSGGGRNTRLLAKPLFKTHTPSGGEVLRRWVTASAERERVPQGEGAGGSQGGDPGYTGAAQGAGAVDWTALRSWTFTAARTQALESRAEGGADGAARQAPGEQSDSSRGVGRDGRRVLEMQGWNSLALFPSASDLGPQAGNREPAGVGPQRRSFGLLLARQRLAPASAGPVEASAAEGPQGLKGRAEEGEEEAGAQPREASATSASQDPTGPTVLHAGGAPVVHHSFPDLSEDPARPDTLHARPDAEGRLYEFDPTGPSSRAEAPPGAASPSRGRQEGVGVARQEAAAVVLPAAAQERGASESGDLSDWEAYLGAPKAQKKAPPSGPSKKRAGARAEARAATGEAKGKLGPKGAGSEGSGSHLLSQSQSQSEVDGAGGELQGGQPAVTTEAAPGTPGAPPSTLRDAGARAQGWRALAYMRGTWRQPGEAGEEGPAGRGDGGGRRSLTLLLPTASKDAGAKAQQSGQARARRRRSFAAVQGEMKEEVGARGEEAGETEASGSGEGVGDATMPRGKGKGLAQLIQSAGGLWPFEWRGAKDRREERMVA